MCSGKLFPSEEVGPGQAAKTLYLGQEVLQVQG